MGKLKLNQKGFTAVEILLTLIFLTIVAAIGVYIAHNHNTNKPVATTSTSTTAAQSTRTTATNPYAGWKTESVPRGVTFKFLSTFKVTTNDGSDNCTGFTSATISAPQNLITSSGITAQGYSIYILRYGTQSDSCAPDGYSTSGTNAKQDGFDNITSIVSSDKISSGVISGNYLSFVQDSGLAGATEALVTSTQYNNATAFTDPGTVTIGGNTYQITVEADTGQSAQNPSPASINLNSFKATDLYKDTLNILNSIQ